MRLLYLSIAVSQIIVVVQSLNHYLALCDPHGLQLPGSSSMGFPRQDYQSRLPFPSPRDLPDSGTEPTTPALAGRFFTTKITLTFYINQCTFVFSCSFSGMKICELLSWVLLTNSDSNEVATQLFIGATVISRLGQGCTAHFRAHSGDLGHFADLLQTIYRPPILNVPPYSFSAHPEMRGCEAKHNEHTSQSIQDSASFLLVSQAHRGHGCCSRSQQFGGRAELRHRLHCEEEQ